MIRCFVFACGTLVFAGHFDDCLGSDCAVSLLQTHTKKSLDLDGWANGMNRCRDMPNGTRSGCRFMGSDASQSTHPRDCAKFARSRQGDGFDFAKEQECVAVYCGSNNVQVTDSSTLVETYSDYCGLERVRKEVQTHCGAPEYTSFHAHPLPPKTRPCRHRPSFRGLVYNNMAAGGMRFKEVFKGADLVMSPVGEYTMGRKGSNGKRGSQLGKLNVASNTSVDIKFQFVETGTTTSKTVAGFTFSVFDIDQGPKCASRSYLNVSNYDSYYVPQDTQLIIKNGDMRNPWTSFMSSLQGTRGDEPKGPNKLRRTQGHTRNSVTFFYNKVDSFTVTFGIKGGVAGGGRNFLFGGYTNLLPGGYCQGVKTLKQVREAKKRRDARKQAARQAKN